MPTPEHWLSLISMARATRGGLPAPATPLLALALALALVIVIVMVIFRPH